MKTLPQDLTKLTVHAPNSKTSTDNQEALWTVIGFFVVVLMMAFLMLVTYVAPSPDQMPKKPTESATSKMEVQI